MAEEAPDDAGIRHAPISLIDNGGARRELGDVLIAAPTVTISHTSSFVVSLADGGLAALQRAAVAETATFIVRDTDTELHICGWITCYSRVGTIGDRSLYRVDVMQTTPAIVTRPEVTV